MFAWLGVGAAMLGIYVATTDMMRKVATSTAAAQAWNSLARDRGEISRRFESSHEVDLDQFWLLNRDMNRVNDAVLHDVPEDETSPSGW